MAQRNTSLRGRCTTTEQKPFGVKSVRPCPWLYMMVRVTYISSTSYDLMMDFFHSVIQINSSSNAVHGGTSVLVQLMECRNPAKTGKPGLHWTRKCLTQGDMTTRRWSGYERNFRMGCGLDEFVFPRCGISILPRRLPNMITHYAARCGLTQFVILLAGRAGICAMSWPDFDMSFTIKPYIPEALLVLADGNNNGNARCPV